MRELSQARGALILAAILFSTGGALIKGTAFDGWQVACLRSFVAALAFPVLVPTARRWPSGAEWLVGIAYASTLVLYVVANKLTTAASTIFLQSTAPLYILALSPWLLGERATRRDVPFLAAMGAGLTLLVVGEPAAQSTAPDPRLGNALALGSGVAWAFTVMGLRRLRRTDAAGVTSSGGAGAVLAGNVLAAAATLPMAWPIQGALHPDWTTIVFLGVVQIALAYRLVTSGLAHVSALDASLLLLVEPVLNPVWAWALHGEEPGLVAVAGGAVLAGATLVRAWSGARATPIRTAVAVSLKPPPEER